MSSTITRRQDWGKADFRALIEDYYDNHVAFGLHPVRKAPSKPDTALLDEICELAMTILDHESQRARELFAELPREPLILSCLLWCGLQTSLSLVRYVVEQHHVSLIKLLSSPMYRNFYGENALHIAIENGQPEVINYLLKGWALVPLSIVDTRSLYAKKCDLSNNVPSFDSSEYFKNIRESAPNLFSEITDNFRDKHSWYFLERMKERWTRKDEHAEDAESVPQIMNNNASGGICERILEDVLQAIYDDEEFYSTCLRRQDIDYLGPLWEVYGHQPELFHLMADWAVSVDAHYFFNRAFLESHQPNKRSNVKFAELLRLWSQSFNPKLAHTASFMVRLQRDWNMMQINWSFFRAQDTIPFSIGLSNVCTRLASYAIAKEAVAAREIMLRLSGQPHVPPSEDGLPVTINEGGTAEEGSTKPDDGVKPNLTCRYLLASAGSGKTQRLMNELSKSYGFYLTSGAIAETVTNIDNGEALYQPQATGSSQDTRLLFQSTQASWLRTKKISQQVHVF